MKVKFLIAALFFSLVAAAQPSNYIKFNTRGRWIAGMFDSTLHVPRFNGSPSLRTGGSSMDGAIAIDTTNNIMYFYSGGAWKRANLDTSAYAVTSVYRKTASDSVFYVKGGVHTFAFKDSTGGGTPTLQQVLTAGGTLTTDHTIDFGGNDFILQGDSIVIKEASGVSKIRFVPGSQSLGRNAKIYLSNTDEWGDGYITAGDEYLETNTGWYVRNSIGYNSALSVNGSFLSSSNPQTAPLVEVIQDGETLFQVANDSIFFRPPLGRFLIDTLNYTLSTTGKKILIRDTATGLVQNIDPSLLGGGSTPTLQQVLTAGSTLTTNNTIDADDNDLTIQSSSSPIGSVIYLSGDQLDLYANSGGPEPSSIRIKGDSLEFEPLLGRMSIDTLAAASNMTNKRVMTWDTVTKRWEQISKDSVGGTGGSTSPAGNYGNLQINRNGAFATPASDSLDFTTGLDIKGHVNVSATSTTGVQFGGTTRIYNDGSRMRIIPSGGEVQFYTAGTGNNIQVFNSGGSNSVVVNGQTGQIYRSTDPLQIQTSGNLGIGSGVGVSATARLHISAGTATASSAPFKLTSGTNLTTPEAGAMEYNGTNLFFTPASAARNNILMTASVNSVSPTSPNRTITVVIDGTTYYIHAKTTND